VGVSLVLVYSFGTAGHCKIGAPVSSFLARNGRIFKFKERSVKDNKVYYLYTLAKHPAQQHSSPGFAGGMTLTAGGGYILGESLVIRLGADPQVGSVFATAVFMELAYDALGKPVPKSEALRQSEFKAYARAITLALGGSPQAIRYKGYPMKITISRAGDNDVVLAVTPELPPGTTLPGMNPAESKPSENPPPQTIN
jgi:hypothetical protein